jgi:hypothetical protein
MMKRASTAVDGRVEFLNPVLPRNPPFRNVAVVSGRVPDSWTAVWVGAPGRTRTSDTRFRKPLLCPLSYGGPAAV